LRAVVGEVFDVAVDIRLGSPTFGRWVGVHLSAENHRQIFIPAGFAHGFCVTSDVAEVEYKCSELYFPEDEITIQWNEPAVGVRWPVAEPLLSKRDLEGKTLAQLATACRSSTATERSRAARSLPRLPTVGDRLALMMHGAPQYVQKISSPGFSSPASGMSAWQIGQDRSGALTSGGSEDLGRALSSNGCR
jgi:hypothetical protein